MRSRLSGLAGSRAAMMSDQIVVGNARPGPPIDVSKRAMEFMKYSAGPRTKCLNRSAPAARWGADEHGGRHDPGGEEDPPDDRPPRPPAPDPRGDAGRVGTAGRG